MLAGCTRRRRSPSSSGQAPKLQGPRLAGPRGPGVGKPPTIQWGPTTGVPSDEPGQDGSSPTLATAGSEPAPTELSFFGRPGSVPQQSTMGVSGHKRSLPVQTNRRSATSRADAEAQVLQGTDQR